MKRLILSVLFLVAFVCWLEAQETPDPVPETPYVLTMKIEGNEQVIKASVVNYAKYFGWTPTVTNETGDVIPNPVSALDAARVDLIRHIKLTVSRQVKKDASRQAEIAAQEAVDVSLADVKMEVTVPVETAPK